MNICQVLFSNGMGGAEKIVQNLCKWLVHYGHNVTILLTEELKSYFVGIKGLKVKAISKTQPGNWSLLTGHTWGNYLKTLLPLLTGRYDVLHVHMPNALMWVDRVRMFLGCPLVFTIHGDMGFAVREGSVWSMTKLLASLRRTEYFTSACNYFFELLKEQDIEVGENGRLIPNGVELSLAEYAKSVSLDGDFTIGFCGGDRYLKGGDILIQAMTMIYEKIPNVMLYVLRKTSSNGYIQKYVRENGLENNVRFVGQVDYDVYCNYLKSVDIVVLPSRTEGIATSLLESMVMSRPIVANSVGGTPEVLTQKRNGLLVKPSPVEIAGAIVQLYEDVELREQIAKNNFRDIQKYGWEKIIKKYDDFYTYVKSKKH